MKGFFTTANADYGTLVLRLAAGAAMLPHGIPKVMGFEGTMGFLTGAGIPWIIALLVIVGESVGAVALMLGFCTRFCAASLAVIMIGAIVFHAGKGDGFETAMLFLLMYVPLVINGAGALSLDAIIAKKLK